MHCVNIKASLSPLTKVFQVRRNIAGMCHTVVAAISTKHQNPTRVATLFHVAPQARVRSAHRGDHKPRPLCSIHRLRQFECRQRWISAVNWAGDTSCIKHEGCRSKNTSSDSWGNSLQRKLRSHFCSNILVWFNVEHNSYIYWVKLIITLCNAYVHNLNNYFN